MIDHDHLCFLSLFHQGTHVLFASRSAERSLLLCTYIPTSLPPYNDISLSELLLLLLIKLEDSAALHRSTIRTVAIVKHDQPRAKTSPQPDLRWVGDPFERGFGGLGNGII